MNYSDEAIDKMCEVLWPLAEKVIGVGDRRQYWNKEELRSEAERILKETDEILSRDYIKQHPGVAAGIGL